MTVGERKQRNDKKREVQPSIGIELKDMIYRSSYITHTPVKDICEFMCVYVMHNEQAINALSSHFRRDIRLNNTLYRGSLDNERIVKRTKEYKERITIRFKQMDYDMISILSYALDCSPSRVVAVLLEIAFSDARVVNMYIKNYLKSELTPTQMKELRNLLSEINSNKEENSSWLSFILAVMDEVAAPAHKMKEAIGEFLANIKRYDDDE